MVSHELTPCGDLYHDLVACKRLLEDEETRKQFDPDYLLLFAPLRSKKKREEDEEDDQNCYHEEVVDPSHVLFLENLKEDGKSYIYECEEDEDGVPVRIKYEGESSLDEECDVEPVRKLRTATNLINRPSDQMFGVEDQHKREMGKKLVNKNKFKSKKEDNAKSSNKLVPDPHYNVWEKCTEISEGGKNNVGKKDSIGSFSGVEIIDADTFYKERTVGFSTEDKNEAECSDGSSSDAESLEDEEQISKISRMQMKKGSRTSTKSMRKVINDFRKPYNKQEHNRHLQEVEGSRQEGRRLDLHNGRERSYLTTKEGKSYLDHYPGCAIIPGPSDQMFGVKDQRKREMKKKQADKLKSKKEDNAKSSNKLVHDPDLSAFWKFSRFSQGCIVYEFEGHKIVYEEVGKNNAGKRKNEGSFPGVEIIDHDTFYKEGTPGLSTESLKDDNDSYGSSFEDEEETSKKKIGSVSDGTTKFRRKVINDLREPYSKQEHEMLLHRIKFRRQEARHLDLRNGRERSYATTKKGKSYLDHYPAVRRRLAQVQHDKQKCLNLLRGFFLYIQQSEPPFPPWDDEECCAIIPPNSYKSSRLPPP